MNEKDYYFDNIEGLESSEIAQVIKDGIVNFEELQSTGLFSADKQREVRYLLNNVEELSKEEQDYRQLNIKNIDDVENFLLRYPNTNYRIDLEKSLKELKTELRKKEVKGSRNEEFEKKSFYHEVLRNPTKFTVTQIKTRLDENQIRELSNDLGYNSHLILNYNPPSLIYGPIPTNDENIPLGFTDNYFWGIPSSGKTCALASIFYTMNNKYNITDADIAIQYGTAYRRGLVNVFEKHNGVIGGTLPPGTAEDLTQYMPFKLTEKGGKRYRNTSFFELSGEVFKSFYEKAYNVEIINHDKKADINKAFQTLELLLKNKNKKNHFFFIDYEVQLKRDTSTGLTQVDYLDAATTYFNSNKNMFNKDTNSVYIIVTKADLIEGENKTQIAKKFLNNKFGNFIDTIKKICEKNSIKFEVKLFSIGEVQFREIGILDMKYSESIVDELLKINPVTKKWWHFLRN